MGPKGRKMTGRCARFWWTTKIPYAQHFSKKILKSGSAPFSCINANRPQLLANRSVGESGFVLIGQVLLANY